MSKNQELKKMLSQQRGLYQSYKNPPSITNSGNIRTLKSVWIILLKWHYCNKKLFFFWSLGLCLYFLCVKESVHFFIFCSEKKKKDLLTVLTKMAHTYCKESYFEWTKQCRLCSAHETKALFYGKSCVLFISCTKSVKFQCFFLTNYLKQSYMAHWTSLEGANLFVIFFLLYKNHIKIQIRKKRKISYRNMLALQTQSKVTKKSRYN